MASRSIIIDTDPGQDDAVAILAALASPELDVRAITAVAGNVPLALTEVNSRKMVELAGRTDVPVYAGAVRPMVRELFTAEFVHGPTGLDGVDLPAPTVPLHDGHAVDILIETLMNSDAGEMTLCFLGPLTNLGLALVLEPRIAPRVRELVLMGGGTHGNVTPAAEFNIYVDPHAARHVFQSGIPVVMAPLDVTHKARATAERLAPFAEMGTAAGDAVAGMLDFYKRYEQHGAGGAPLHDPCVIAYLLAPELFTGRRCSVEVVSHGPAVGATLIDWTGVTGRDANALVLDEVDADAFFALIADRIRRLP